MTASESPQAAGHLERLRQGLRRTREGILGKIGALIRGEAPARDWTGDLEAALIQADLGPRAASRIVAAVTAASSARVPPSWEGVRDAARRVLREILAAGPPLPEPARPPRVILVVGVNGGGKTTTAAKLARRLRAEGKSVVLCAADTFRAGAGEQLRVWAERVGAGFVGHRPGADPSAVIFDAAAAAVARGADALIVDTAGRLHTQDPLMRELEKIVRVVGRRVEGAPHEVLLVLDATTGQNGVNQARQFMDAARVNGLVLTKVDGTAKGGVAVRIVQELGIPLRYVGVGEGPDDLVDFDPDEFLEGLLPSAA
ncbi:MAG TPA: signal recognition particle-docking protein FtsY [Candidatus Polarisedimenticolia bacterium]|jgi:fused signal recognition particle receptor|nr:signal recognition particle-docking protein FtsY [Candidatus Polarisedimenticolia bacterium]